MKILISDKLPQEGIDVLKSTSEFQVDCIYDLTREELKEKIRVYDALIVRSTTNVTSEIIEAATNLKVIGRAGVGLDNVDLNAAAKKEITVLNTPSANTTSTAEHTFALILSLARNISQSSASVKLGQWDRARFKGVELKGKKLGIIGFGRIGSVVAGYAQAFGMEVVVYDPFLAEDVKKQKDVNIVEINELLRISDFITIHVPLVTATRNLISDKEFGLMKENVRLINCARGGIVDEEALIKALDEKRIAGCALDVCEQEPIKNDSPLLNFDNCVITPHIGAATCEAQVNVAVEIAQSVSEVLLAKMTTIDKSALTV